MTDYEKACIIAGTLHRAWSECDLRPEWILAKATPEELTFYARWCLPL